MIISNQTVTKVADLARITKNPTPEFLAKYTNELSSIIQYIDQLQVVDTKDISPDDGVRTIKVTSLREDSITDNPAKYLQTRNNIINNFPSRQGDLLVLPGIFEER